MVHIHTIPPGWLRPLTNFGRELSPCKVRVFFLELLYHGVGVQQVGGDWWLGQLVFELGREGGEGRGHGRE